MATEVVDVPDQRRFEIRSGEEVAGFAAYVLTEDLITFTHTEIGPAFEGTGMASTLVRGALDNARSRGLAVLPRCPFVKGWIERHPDYSHLVHRPSAE